MKTYYSKNLNRKVTIPDDILSDIEAEIAETPCAEGYNQINVIKSLNKVMDRFNKDQASRKATAKKGN